MDVMVYYYYYYCYDHVGLSYTISQSHLFQEA